VVVFDDDDVTSAGMGQDDLGDVTEAFGGHGGAGGVVGARLHNEDIAPSIESGRNTVGRCSMTVDGDGDCLCPQHIDEVEERRKAGIFYPDS
jgi:hypothetical protein